MVVAILAVVVGFSADLQPSMRWPVALGAVVAIGFAVMPLLPRRTPRQAGLPSVVLMRGIVAGAFFAAEAYIPYLLMKKFDFTATWAGIALMLAALAWAGASALQGRFGSGWGITASRRSA